MDVLSHTSCIRNSAVASLSSRQLNVWRAHASNPKNPGLSIAEYLEIEGMLHPTTFIRAVSRAVAETEALHLCFRETSQGPCQFLGAKMKWVLAFLDHTDEPDPYTAAKEWMEEDICQFMDIKEGPLFSIALFRCAIDRHLYYFRCHRILAENFDRYLVTKRIADLYSASLDSVLAQQMRPRLDSMYSPEKACLKIRPTPHSRQQG
jgi:hypothetical protein